MHRLLSLAALLLLSTAGSASELSAREELDLPLEQLSSFDSQDMAPPAFSLAYPQRLQQQQQQQQQLQPQPMVRQQPLAWPITQPILQQPFMPQPVNPVLIHQVQPAYHTRLPAYSLPIVQQQQAQTAPISSLPIQPALYPLQSHQPRLSFHRPMQQPQLHVKEIIEGEKLQHHRHLEPQIKRPTRVHLPAIPPTHVQRGKSEVEFHLPEVVHAPAPELQPAAPEIKQDSKQAKSAPKLETAVALPAAAPELKCPAIEFTHSQIYNSDTHTAQHLQRSSSLAERHADELMTGRLLLLCVSSCSALVLSLPGCLALPSPCASFLRAWLRHSHVHYFVRESVSLASPRLGGSPPAHLISVALRRHCRLRAGISDVPLSFSCSAQLADAFHCGREVEPRRDSSRLPQLHCCSSGSQPIRRSFHPR